MVVVPAFKPRYGEISLGKEGKKVKERKKRGKGEKKTKYCVIPDGIFGGDKGKRKFE